MVVLLAILLTALPAFAQQPRIKIQMAEVSNVNGVLVASATVTVSPANTPIRCFVQPNIGTATPCTNDGNGVITTTYTPPSDLGPGVAASGEVQLCAEANGVEARACAPIFLPLQFQRGGPFERTIVGYEQAGASAAQTAGKFFFDLYLARPWFGKRDDLLGPRVRTFGNLRITSAPQQISSPVAQFSAEFVNRIGELKVNEVAQAAELLAGVEVRLMSMGRSLISFSQNERATTSLSFIAAGGAITPLNPKDGTELYYAPQPGSQAFARFVERYGPQAISSSTQFIAFAPLDRERFFRQYYAGIRLQTHYLAPGGSPRSRPPHTFDLMFGKNESVTGGRLHGKVARIEAFYALPFSDRFLYLFGNAVMRLQREPGSSDPLILDRLVSNNEPGRPSFTTIADPRVSLVAIPAGNRDTWRIGVGIDFVSALRTLIDAKVKKPGQ